MVAPRANGVKVTPLPKNPHWVNFLWSDGTPTKPPSEDPTPDAEGNVNYFRRLSPEESQTWRINVGNILSKILHGDGNMNWVIDDWPQNYVLYVHLKGKQAAPRHDIYLLGSRATGKFRSPQEFGPHAVWLLKDETRDPANCQCRYCTKSPQRDISRGLQIAHKGAHSLTPGSSPAPSNRISHPRRAPGPPPPPINLRKVDRKNKPRPGPKDAAAAERIKDLRETTRFYREQELVWVKLPGSIVDPETDVSIDFWPGIVMMATLRVKEKEKESKVEELEAEEEYDPKKHLQNTTRAWVYKVKMLAAAQHLYSPQSDVLPYLSYTISEPLLNCIRNLPRPVTAPEDTPVHVPDENGLSSFKEALVMYTIAMQTSARIMECYGVSDQWTSRSQILGSQEIHLQGLWWGAERIWVDDIVRLKIARRNIGSHCTKAMASEETGNRATFLKIDDLIVENVQGAQVCFAAGQLFELAPETFEEPSSESSEPAVEPIPSVWASPILTPALPNPPMTTLFRPILLPSFEVRVELGMIAGRYYPELVFHNSLLRDHLQIAIQSVAEKPTPDDFEPNYMRRYLWALAGLEPGLGAAMECFEFYQSRVQIVRASDALARKDLRVVLEEEGEESAVQKEGEVRAVQEEGVTGVKRPVESEDGVGADGDVVISDAPPSVQSSVTTPTYSQADNYPPLVIPLDMALLADPDAMVIG